MKGTKHGLAIISLMLVVLLVACFPNPDNQIASLQNREQTYTQLFKTDIAWIALEWNGKLYGYGSGFLKDKEAGVFYTNKHVSDMFNALGQGSHKIFFNGRIYNAEIQKLLPLVDAALIRITDTFDPAEFPEPKPLARQNPEVGDIVFIEGFHPHPYAIRISDKDEGYDYPIISILSEYYGMATRHLDKEREIVFEGMEAEVTELNKKSEINNPGGSRFIQDLRSRTNLHTEIRTLKDHKFSFGGLSGTRVINEHGEVVGIFTATPQEELDPIEDQEDDDDTDEESPHLLQLSQIVHKTGLLTPVDSIRDLD